MKFGLREHRGSLEESLKTVKYITREEYLLYLDKYEFYSYDTRCNQLLCCLRDGVDCSLPFWLFIEF